MVKGYGVMSAGAGAMATSLATPPGLMLPASVGWVGSEMSITCRPALPSAR